MYSKRHILTKLLSEKYTLKNTFYNISDETLPPNKDMLVNAAFPVGDESGVFNKLFDDVYISNIHLRTNTLSYYDSNYIIPRGSIFKKTSSRWNCDVFENDLSIARFINFRQVTAERQTINTIREVVDKLVKGKGNSSIMAYGNMYSINVDIPEESTLLVSVDELLCTLDQTVQMKVGEVLKHLNLPAVKYSFDDIKLCVTVTSKRHKGSLKVITKSKEFIYNDLEDIRDLLTKRRMI